MIQNVRSRNIVITEIAVSVALSFVLHSFLTIFKMPYGGSINFGLTPLLVLTFRRGVLVGCLSGLISSILSMFFSLNIPPTNDILKIIFCIILDYVFPNLCVGLASIFSKFSIDNRVKIFFGVFTINLLRFISFCLSGLIVWHNNTPLGESIIKYIIIYNLTYCLPSFLANLILCLSLKSICFPHFFNINKENQ